MLYTCMHINVYIHVFAHIYSHDTHKGGDASHTLKGVGKGGGPNTLNRYVIALKAFLITLILN